MGDQNLKAGIVKASALGKSWLPSSVFADTKKLDRDIAAAQANLKRAKQRLERARKAKQDALAREQELIDRGDLTIIASD